MADIVQLVENGVKKYLKTHAMAVDGLYAVGDVVFSAKSDNPAARFGGTWERFGQGQFIVGASETDIDFTAGKTGGEKTTTLAASHMPKDFKLTVQGADAVAGSKSQLYSTASGSVWGITGNITQIATNAGGQAHNNLPPYIALYMWVKTA